MRNKRQLLFLFSYFFNIFFFLLFISFIFFSFCIILSLVAIKSFPLFFLVLKKKFQKVHAVTPVTVCCNVKQFNMSLPEV